LVLVAQQVLIAQKAVLVTHLSLRQLVLLGAAVGLRVMVADKPYRVVLEAVGLAVYQATPEAI
jgi:hypothetical protein